MFVDLVESEDVLRAVKTRGPMIPMDIRKFLGKGDSITIGAALSTLLSKNLIYSTSVKIGGSPFYYVRGQENKLELLNKYLNDKDKRVFERLREEKILKDSSLEPLVRVSLRNIPDFAKKVELSNQGETVLYWRWYFVREEDAIDLIRGKIQKRDLSSNPSPFAAHQSQQLQQHATSSNSSAKNSEGSNNQSNVRLNQQNNSQSSTQARSASQNPAREAWQNNNQQSSISQTKTRPQPQPQFPDQSQNNSQAQNQGVQPQNNFVNQENSQGLTRNRGISEIKKSSNNISKQASSAFNSEQKTISDDVPDFDDDFFKQLKSFFVKNNITMKQAELIRKNSDFEFVVELNTPFGATEYFCKAKSKKKCNEGDLSSAYLQGQNKRMPTVFITTGEITKKAKSKARDEYKGLLVKEL